MARLRLYADELNADLSVLPCRGPASRYSLPDEGLSGRLELKFFDAFASGVACSMESEGEARDENWAEHFPSSCKVGRLWETALA